MKRTFIQTAIFLSLISLNSNLLYGDIINYANGDVYEGYIKLKYKFPIFWEEIPNRKGKYTWVNGDVYEGNWRDGKETGKGRFTIADKETKKTFIYSCI